jgi:hypothetical protein
VSTGSAAARWAPLLANAVAPGILDRYLARTGFQSQQTPEDRDPDQPVNLWEPADEKTDFGTRGVFSDRSKGSSVQVWASHHHWLFGAAGTAAGAGLIALLKRRS